MWINAATKEVELAIAYDGIMVDTNAWAGLEELFNRCLVPSSELSPRRRRCRIG